LTNGGDDQQSVHSSDTDSNAAACDNSSFADHAPALPSLEEGASFGGDNSGAAETQDQEGDTTTNSNRNRSSSSSGQPLGAYFRNVLNKTQAQNLAADDVSISSSTTASVTNGANNKRRYALPILASSLDFRQVELDVARCTWHLLTGDQRIQRIQMEHKRNRKVARLIRRKQRRLANLINYTLVQSYPMTSPHKLRYYQGYHDVACIFMSVLGGGGTVPRDHTATGVPQDMQELAAAMGLDLPARVLVQVSQSHLRDFLKSDFTELQTAIELTLFPLIAKLDPPIYNFLRSAGMQPFFALSWVITWFSHEVRDTVLVKRLFDCMLVSHPLLPIYLSVAMVVHPVNRQIVLAAENDFGTVHQTLRNLTKNSSMTGWKYRPGDGYVSDDGEEEDDDDDDGVVGDTLEQAGIDGDINRIKSELYDEGSKSKNDDPNTTTSSVSTCGDSLPEGFIRVPFQELIDLALDIMRRVPPRKLLPLAVRCYGGPHVGALLARAPNIRLFADPQPWAVRSVATADWVQKQRARKGHDKGEDTVKVEDDIEDVEPLKEVLLRKRDSPAVIALGFGEGDDKIRRKRKRNRMIAGAIGVALLAIAVGVTMNSHFSAEKESRTCTRSKGTGIDSQPANLGESAHKIDAPTPPPVSGLDNTIQQMSSTSISSEDISSAYKTANTVPSTPILERRPRVSSPPRSDIIMSEMSMRKPSPNEPPRVPKENMVEPVKAAQSTPHQMMTKGVNIENHITRAKMWFDKVNDFRMKLLPPMANNMNHHGMMINFPTKKIVDSVKKFAGDLRMKKDKQEQPDL